MLRVTIELLPGGRADRARVIGRALIGQTAKRPGTLRAYAAAIWDDWTATPTTATAEHDRLAGVWRLVATVVLAQDDATSPRSTHEQALLHQLEQDSACECSGRSHP